jgi:alpha-1,3-mannosyltransferase
MARAVPSTNTGFHKINREMQNPKWSPLVARLVWVFDALLSAAILFKIKCTCVDLIRRSDLTDTEIDWKAYMEQVEQFLAGERDYALIKGGTGPLW